MQIIFLDIDGVLVNLDALRQGGSDGPVGHSDCVACLNWLTRESEAKIVVSSIWRKEGLAAISRRLASWGVEAEIIDITPDLGDVPRGCEIEQWLADHPCVSAFVILDDDRDMGDLTPHLICTDFRAGLTQENARQALGLLNEQEQIDDSWIMLR